MKNKHVDVVRAHFIFGMKLAYTLLLTITAAQANDSAGYIGTGGVILYFQVVKEYVTLFFNIDSASNRCTDFTF